MSVSEKIITFTHIAMEKTDEMIFDEKSCKGLSVGIKRASLESRDTRLIDEPRQLLQSCSAIIFINNTDKRVALYHYPAGRLKKPECASKQEEIINKLLGDINPDEIHIYTGYQLDYCLPQSFIEDQKRIEATLKKLLGSKDCEIKSCFVSSGTAYVFYDNSDSRIIAGTSGCGGELFPYDQIPASDCMNINHKTRAFRLCEKKQ